MIDSLELILLLLLATMFAFPVAQNLYRSWSNPVEKEEETNSLS